MSKMLGRGFLLLALISCLFFLVSCMNLEDISEVRYRLRVETEDGVQEGRLFLQIAPEAEEYKVKVDFSLRDENFSGTFTVAKDDLRNVFGSLLLSNPSLGKILGILSASQALLLPALLSGKELEEGFEWREKSEGQETVITVPSSETRFGKEALWVEIQKDGQNVLRGLFEREEYFPLVLDIQDKETLEEDQKSLFIEAEDVVWKNE
ncbi:MAG: hypothetical protein ACUVTO_09050 [Candidatus Caldatribacteriaceae bacterium]